MCITNVMFSHKFLNHLNNDLDHKNRKYILIDTFKKIK